MARKSKKSPSFDPQEVAHGAIRLVQRNIDRLNAEMDGVADEFCSPQHARLAAELARSMTGLVKELRSLQKDAKRRADSMTLPEQIETFLEWFEDLPTARQKTVVQRATQIINERRTANG